MAANSNSNIPLVAEATWSGTLANLTDVLASDTASDLVATIDWGDSTTSPGTLVGSNGFFTVGGTHTYSPGFFGEFYAYISVSDPVTGATASTLVLMEAGITAIPLQNATNAICAGPDGNMWFTVPAGQIGRVTLAGVVTLFSLPTGSYPFAIAPGSDGNLWFTDLGAVAIGRITPSGDVTDFPLAAGAQPRAMTLGPDGNPWFTDVPRNLIGTITPSGTIQEFFIPTANAEPLGIAAGPDGNVWFTEAGPHQIGRIAPTGGQVTEFAGTSGQPIGIVAGSDGKLWFSQQLTGDLGRITPAGVMERVSVGPPTLAIAAGPDGKIWVAFSSIQDVASVTPAGAVSTSWSVPFAVNGMAAGPDGNLWFAESLGVAHVSP
jgi:streptogramin lyase